MAVAIHEEAGQANASENGSHSTAQRSNSGSTTQNLLGSSDSSTSDDKEEEQKLIQNLQKEMMLDACWRTSPQQEGESTVRVEKSCSMLFSAVKIKTSIGQVSFLSMLTFLISTTDFFKT